VRASTGLARILAIAILGAALWFPARAQAAESFDGCTGYIDALPATISAPGTWCLRKDLHSAASDWYGILVDADDAVLDCKGFQVDGRQADNVLTEGVFMYGNLPHDRVTVRNCTVRGYSDGIWVIGNEGVVADNRVIEAGRNGIAISGDNGSIRRNRVTRTGGGPDGEARGIQAYGSVDILDNDVVGFAMDPGQRYIEGIVSGGFGSVVQGNRVRLANASDPAPGMSVSGILLIDPDAVTVRDNLVVGTGDAVGIACLYGPDGAGVITRDNLLAGVAQALTCTDGGGNAASP
jgi:hypothetical protein